jgi:hypothetical protein
MARPRKLGHESVLFYSKSATTHTSVVVNSILLSAAREGC